MNEAVIHGCTHSLATDASPIGLFFHRQLALSANSDYQQQLTNSLTVHLKYQNLFAENIIS